MNWPALEMGQTNGDEGDPVLTEPEIVRVIAVGGASVRVDGGALYIDAWETLPGEKRVVCRLSMTPDVARDVAAQIRKKLPRQN